MQLYQALITLDGWTFLAQVCNLMIQLVIFKKLLLNPGKKVIAERKAKADSQIADAEKLRTEAEAMKAEYEQNLQNARTEANEIVANAQKTATARGVTTTYEYDPRTFRLTRLSTRRDPASFPSDIAPTADWQAGAKDAMCSRRHCSDALPPGGTLEHMAW